MAISQNARLFTTAIRLKFTTKTNSMIPKQDLRIGNYVLTESVENKYLKIEYGEQIDYCAIYNNPIHLSPDILSKAGFTKDNAWWGDGISYYNLPLPNCPDLTKEIDVRFGDEEGKLGENEVYAVFIGQQDIKNCRYLHQLQNLIFALSGEEINIQL